MRKYEFNGETYYYHNGKYVDSNFIEVDVLTSQELAKLTGIYDEDGVIRKRTHDFSNNAIRKTLEPISKQSQISMKKPLTNKQIMMIDKYTAVADLKNVKKELCLDSQPIKKVFNDPIKEKIKVDIKEPKLSDFGLSEKDFEIYSEQLNKYKEEENSVNRYNKNIEEQDAKRIWVAIFTCIGFVLLFRIIDTSPSFLIFSFVIGVFIACAVKMMITPEPKQVSSRSYFVSEELEKKIKAYNLAVHEYKEACEMAKLELAREKREYWDNMSGHEFETAVSDLFASAGAKAITTKGSGDHGIDIEVFYKDTWYAVQCKHHASPVGPAPVRELRGVIQGKFKKGIFVSLNGYTQSVYEENKHSEKNIILLDREKIMRIAELKSLDFFLYK